MRDGTRTSDYDFDLPEALIAQAPAARRDASRLMVVRRDTGTIEHRTFGDLAEMIPAGDVLATNVTRVVRARLIGTRESGGRAEIFLLRPLGGRRYEAMVHPGSKLRPGRRVRVADDLVVSIESTTERGTRVVVIEGDDPADELVERRGHMPLPPYIGRPDAAEDAERYQTVYGRVPGSVAAPTAGLHFTPELLARLEAGGVRRAEVVLHVGVGTFKPVEVEDPAAHVMHEERYELPAEAAGVLNAARDAGGHVWAVGTTALRTLESAIGDDGRFAAAAGETRLFVRPPARVRSIDRLITNFHLPRSTLLMLVAAVAGYDLTMRAYQEAIDAGYRFYSYGDAMLVT